MVMEIVVDLLSATSTELILFLLAFALQFSLFGNVWWPFGKRATKKVKKLAPEDDETMPASGFENMRHAYEKRDHRAILRYWRELKESVIEVPADVMAMVIESHQRSKKDCRAILSEVSAVMLKSKTAHSIEYVNAVLDPICRSLDCQLAAGVVHLCPTLGVDADAKTYELLVQMHFATRSFEEVTKLNQQMRFEGIQPTTRTSLAFLKTAVSRNQFDEALQYIREIPFENVAAHVSDRLIDLACREQKLGSILPDIESGKMRMSMESLNGMLAECCRRGDGTLATRVIALATRQDVQKNCRTWSLIIRAAGSDSKRIIEILDEISSAKIEVNGQISAAVLGACASTKDLSLAGKLAELVTTRHEGHLQVSLGLVRFYAENGHAEEACNMYEDRLKVDTAGGQKSQLDARTLKSLFAASQSCGRKDITADLVEADANCQVDTLKKLVKANDFGGALTAFDALDRSKAPLDAYRFALQACVELEHLMRAKELLSEMIVVGEVDIAAFNILLKAYMKIGEVEKACAMFKEMKKTNCTPNSITFNEIASFLTSSNRAAQRNSAWEAMDLLISMGGKATRNGCTQIFKHLKNSSSNAEINRTMKLLDHLEEPMSDGLLACGVEACVRLGKKHVLAQKLELLQGDDPVKITSAHNFGSIIKGYSCLGDVNGAWQCWRDMYSQHITPTSITIGCMVEAVARNGDVDGAHDLIQTLLSDKETRSNINAIIYGSVLKGYGRAGRMERLWSTFEEMKLQRVELSLMTFNALLDACARNKQMEHVHALILEMRALGLKPNIITHSTLIKAFCAVGDMKSAFDILGDLRRGENKPDEVVYNTMIEGCLHAGVVSEGEQMIEDMMSEGVPPSNYTLTMLARLLGQNGRVERAVEMVEDASTKFHLKLNSHVHTALVQAYMNIKNHSQAARRYFKATRERCSVDAKTCRDLCRSLMHLGKMDLATDLLRNMLGLDENQRRGCSSTNLLLEDSFLSDFFNALVGGSRKGSGRTSDKSVAPRLLEEIKSLKPDVRIDPSVMRKIAGSN
eukprot:TRINITY_DN12382_c0_g2_i1.p1 TRINITY_DN12382_c0_g2~~TRINITY_DN12382_c0_g2_i1.p1  ORF type:complete len:1033 (+),score=227.93 TRINITY_DN12382_c0_g2_i1:229-3327(+)